MTSIEEVSDMPWSLSADSVLDSLGASEVGLGQGEVEERTLRFGKNIIADADRDSLWLIWWRQFKSLIVALLLVAAIVSAVIGDWMEAAAVLVVVLINAVIGFVTEWRALSSMEALKRLTTISVRVRRDGVSKSLPAADLVPGDLVILEAGDVVPADLRIVEANQLQSDESSLTGESAPIQKQMESVDGEAILAERKSMLFRSAKITAGTGKGVVTATGTSSELGKISTMLAQVEKKATPLERQLAKLGYRLIWVTLGITVLIALIGIVTGRELALMIQTAIALAVAAIPEGLPVVATIALARGLWRMSERNALINRLSAVETLGATGIICTDKTGTLTENRMTVVSVWPQDRDQEVAIDAIPESERSARRVLEFASLCNNASVGSDGVAAVGDPLEVALLEGALAAGVNLENLTCQFHRDREVPFDAASRMMATSHHRGEEEVVCVKGAPEAVFSHCQDLSAGSGEAIEDQLALWLKRNSQMAAQGLRVIAVAEKSSPGQGEDPYSKLSLLGLVGLLDPPRADVPAAIGDCVRAGIRLVMITGDQAATAEAVAKSIGMESIQTLQGAEIDAMDLTDRSVVGKLLQANVVARATPEQKLTLVRLYQNEGQTVAMTGDGVNDAPALKQADIGIAMGLRGTDVAREAAAMVLRDDAFPSIVAAIRQGRTIFANIRKFVAYLISCNASEILVVGAATLFSQSLPILPLQILYLNLVTDVFPALALGVTRSSGDVLKNPPRPKGEPVLRSRDWVRIAWQAMLIAGATLGAFFFAIHRLGQTTDEAITVSFLTLAVAQLFHVFNMSEAGESFWKSSVAQSRLIWAAILLCLMLLALACYQPVVAAVLHLRPPGISDLQVVFGFAILPVFAELIRRGLSRFER